VEASNETDSNLLDAGPRGVGCIRRRQSEPGEHGQVRQQPEGAELDKEDAEQVRGTGHGRRGHFGRSVRSCSELRLIQTSSARATSARHRLTCCRCRTTDKVIENWLNTSELILIGFMIIAWFYTTAH